MIKWGISLQIRKLAFIIGMILLVLTGKVISVHGATPSSCVNPAFNQTNQSGGAILANSDSSGVSALGQPRKGDLADGMGETVGQFPNQVFTVLTALAGVFLLLELGVLGIMGYAMRRGERRWRKIRGNKSMFLLIPILFTLLMISITNQLPSFLGIGSWENTFARMPFSFTVALILIGCVWGIALLILLAAFFFPDRRKIVNELPLTVILSLVAGVANTVMILIITNSTRLALGPAAGSAIFGLVLIIYVLGNKCAKSRLIRMSNHAIYDLRMELIAKVAATNYQNFESIDKGRIYATLHDDTETIGTTAVMFVPLIINGIMIACIFIYMSVISFWMALGMFGVSALVSLCYYLFCIQAEQSLEKARDSLGDYLRLISGLLDGFKELSMHRAKSEEYQRELEESCGRYRDHSKAGSIHFNNAMIWGDSLFLILLAGITFFLPAFFPGIIRQSAILQFTMIVLYLIGSVNEIMSIIPMAAKMRVSWKRVHEFIRDIPVSGPEAGPAVKKEPVQSFALEDVVFEYPGQGMEKFVVGPVSFKLSRGQILFIIGGNGSGKTTLAKLITGLYSPHSGRILINGRKVEGVALSEYFSAVFSDLYLFKKMYNADLQAKQAVIQEYLTLLQLDNKVTVENNTFSTVDLSGGQRKRLALLKCYLEDNPIYLFDEWAADQDPHFRRFFYRVLLPGMKREGKIIIAITHDDHYFDVADMLIKLDFGKIDAVNEGICEVRLGNQ
jgi:putative ATP-binding cassette transporter